MRSALIWAAAFVVQAAEVDERLRALLEESPVTRRALVGVRVEELRGKVLFELNSERYFIPASNAKLLTMAMGLVRLGPQHRFQTVVITDQAPDSAGRIAGLALIGGGDPNLSGREIPYRVNSPVGDPLAAIEDLAGQIVARGVRRIDGEVIGDDTLYEWEPYPDGWALEDATWDFGAPVSALSINDNAVSVTIRPGDPARIAIQPPLEYFHIDNRVRQGLAEPIRIERDPGSRQVRISGALPVRHAGETHRLAVDDPALYAAIALRDALARRGVAIRGEAVARHRYRGDAAVAPPRGIELARRSSAPLVENLRITSKVSQNLHAEMLVRAAGLNGRGAGTREAGLKQMQSFLVEAGIDRDEFRLSDGSGLSRVNLVTPAAVVKLLRYMHASEHRETWMSLLPVGGEDGTLRLRFQKTAAVGRIRGKTGSLGQVTTLSGYAERGDGSLLAFSIMLNNQGLPGAEARALVDKLCLALIE